MLGVTKQGAHNLVRHGKLDRRPGWWGVDGPGPARLLATTPVSSTIKEVKR